MTQTLAIYDMDRTVTRRPTFGAFLWHAMWRLAPWRALLSPLTLFATLGYALKLYDRGRLKEINYRLLVGPAAPERLEPVVQSFAQKQCETNILPGARTRIAEDKAAGRRLVLATASYRLYAAAIAQKLGFDDVIATDTKLDTKGRTIATIDGRNCYGFGKLDMIEAWLQRQGLERDAVHIRFYSDHVSDSVVHRWANEAFATNPHARLIRVAEQEGWEVLEWRDRKRA
ncbi:MAG TPA: HAD-IB family phosphatase [Allosphingosinicella sp.]|nr:HAD-IB family phosphatase [Allosphingosinicella sp.]